MKTLPEHIKANKLPLISLNEKLLINKNFKNLHSYNFENVDEVYGISLYKLDKTFYIAKYEVEDVCKINNNPVRYEITGASTYYGFKDLQCKLINDYNILYNDGSRNFILIHPDDEEKLELLTKFANKLRENDKYQLDTILKDRLKIDYTKFMRSGFAYRLDPFDYYRCDMGDGTINELIKDLEKSLKQII